jgi:glycosyltransferase involved in cell wall biosynthesis
MTIRVCYLGTYEADYDRNRIVQRGLRESGASVIECHEAVWGSRRHKTATLTRPLALARLGAELMTGYARLARRYLVDTPDHDVVVIGYLGHLDMLALGPLCRARKKPIVFDAFISLYDTLVFDRAVVSPRSPAARALKLVDRAACALADLVLLDTQAHADYFADDLGVPAAKCRRVLVGAEPAMFHPVEASRADAPFTVFHYSKFAPLHGIRTMLEAAAALRDQRDIRFLLVGGGQLERQVASWIDELRLDNLEHRRWMEPDELRATIASAGACLGIFGDTPKASRVIPNKVYQCMAVGAPIITRDSPGARELLRDGEHALLCPPADAEALSGAIVRLRDDPTLAARLGANARALFDERCTPAAIGRALLGELETLTA